MKNRQLPVNVRQAILSGNREALSAMGRMGAKKRVQQRSKREILTTQIQPDVKMKAAHDE